MSFDALRRGLASVLNPEKISAALPGPSQCVWCSAGLTLPPFCRILGSLFAHASGAPRAVSLLDEDLAVQDVGHVLGDFAVDVRNEGGGYLRMFF